MSPIHFFTAPPPIPLRWDRHFQQRLAKTRKRQTMQQLQNVIEAAFEHRANICLLYTSRCV
ncbi:hypothetical protein [Erwinia amylovora]